MSSIPNDNPTADPGARPVALDEHPAWLKTLDLREMKEIELARLYVADFNHGTPGHMSYQVINRLFQMVSHLEKELVIAQEKLGFVRKQNSEMMHHSDRMYTKALEKLQKGVDTRHPPATSPNVRRDVPSPEGEYFYQKYAQVKPVESVAQHPSEHDDLQRMVAMLREQVAGLIHDARQQITYNAVEELLLTNEQLRKDKADLVRERDLLRKEVAARQFRNETTFVHMPNHPDHK